MATRPPQSDLRVVKTNAALIGAFEELLREKPFEKITVKTICDRALVSRATFYAHYRDKYELFHAVISARFDTFDEGGITHADSFENGFADLLAFLRDDEMLRHRTSIGAIDFEIAELVTNVLSARVLEQIDNGAWRLKNPQIDASFAVTYIAYGVAGVVASWIRGGREQSEREVAHTIALLLKELLEPVR